MNDKIEFDDSPASSFVSKPLGKQSGSAPLRRAALILEVVAAGKGEITLQQIAHELSLPVSTTHRLIQSLLGIGFLMLDSQRKTYRIGERVTRLVHMSMDTATIAQIAQPVLTGLADRYSQVAYITQLVGEEVRLATYVFPSNSKQALVFPGQIFPIHATAAGRATFASQPAELIERQLRRPLEKLQPETNTDPDAVRAELAAVRKRGYAVSDSEVDPGVFAVACPVRSAHSHVIFAVGINGMAHEMHALCPVETYVEALRRAADELARLI